jgi:hypothetical protein
VANSPLSFEGEHPLQHSSDNYVHLWMLEHCAERQDWIDVEYRTEFVKYVLEQWRRRLKGLTPYRQRGYRLYVYEGFAPTLSVVAETDYGFPYSMTPLYVEGISGITSLYASRQWSQNFGGAWDIDPDVVLSTIEKHAGSIGKPSAQALHMQVGALRKLIVAMGIESSVNTIRKRFKRQPAKFGSVSEELDVWHVFERILPPHYE